MPLATAATLFQSTPATEMAGDLVWGAGITTDGEFQSTPATEMAGDEDE